MSSSYPHPLRESIMLSKIMFMLNVGMITSRLASTSWMAMRPFAFLFSESISQQSRNRNKSGYWPSSKSFSSAGAETQQLDFEIDPESHTAKEITRSLGVSDEQHQKLTALARLVVDWNERLNLISRKDCSVPVLFGRHILPSIAIGAVPLSSSSTSPYLDQQPLLSGIFSMHSSAITRKKTRVIDVGTGGGFPGLPLAILFPHVDFLLVDSIGKKLKAIDEMAQELQVTNVNTYHGRVEEMVHHPIHGMKHKQAYDFCVGRSVAALPTFCFWIKDLLKTKDGQLLYIIGGNIDPAVEAKLAGEIPINSCFGQQQVSDKRILIFQAKQVGEIAVQSGEKKRIIGTPKEKKSFTKMSSRTPRVQTSGAWKKREHSIQKDATTTTTYDNFKRYES